MVEPLSAAVAEAAKVAANTSVKEVIKDLTSKEAAENVIKEAPLRTSMETIENTSLEALKARNEVNELSQIELNRESGVMREEKARKMLLKEFPPSNRFEIHSEAYLRDKNGGIKKDLDTGEARRIDFVISKDNKIVKSVEVTSETAPKKLQIEKENRIRDAGGKYIKIDVDGKLIRFPEKLKTEIWRYS